MKKRLCPGWHLVAILALFHAGALCRGGIMFFQRDTAGRLGAVTYTNGNAHTYSYDAAGNLLQRLVVVGVGGSGEADADHDGLPDEWERLYFGGLFRDGTGDFDGDGQSDEAEFRAGTVPNDAGSALRVLPDPQIGPGVTVQWQSVANKTYRLQYKNSLSDPDWTDVPGDVLATGSVAAKTDASVASQALRFYRVLLVE